LSAQVNYEPGYYIDNNNDRKEIQIKNIDWLDNPKSIEYIDDSSTKKTLSIDDVKEFGINNGVVFSRYIVQIDKSSTNTNSLSNSREPEFEEEQVFLKKIASGRASLFYFSNKNIRQYFYTLNNDTPETLVNKKYLIGTGRVGTNKAYKQQLKTGFKCLTNKNYKYENLVYNAQALLNIFKEYNSCEGSNTQVHNLESEKFQNENKFIFRVKTGGRSNIFSLISENSVIDFPTSIGFQFGLEGEFLFNFNRNKWSALLEISHFSYQDEVLTNSQDSPNQKIDLDYSAIEASLGARHSFFLSDKSRIFINGNFIIPINLNQSLKRATSPDFEEFVSLSNFAFGIGFEHSKISAEIKYGGPRTLINGLSTKYSNISLTLGYKIL